jgi:N-glycosylase/DNA lyase
MKKLADAVEKLRKSEVKGVIDDRLKEFEDLGKKSSNELFKEMCFCLLTANCAADKCMAIQKSLGGRGGFLTLSEQKLAARLRELGYRFPNVRAKYISEARKHKDHLKETIESFEKESDLREWLVKNVKGLGYKESSHFLRNIGFKDFAILDFHIIDVLEEHNMIDRPKTLTPKKYIEIEGELKKIGKKLGLNMAELDLYLWRMETGKVLK